MNVISGCAGVRRKRCALPVNRSADREPRPRGATGRTALVLVFIVAITVPGIVTPGYVRVANPLLALPPTMAAAMLGP